MMENNSSKIDKLCEVLKSMQTLVQCTICLETISVPMKTRCGHSFCRACITRVLNKKNASCPLCNASLKRRSISDDEHVETCIDRLHKIVTALQIDTGIDILSHVKKPQSTRESGTPHTTHVAKSRVPKKQVPNQENLWQRFVTRKSEEPPKQSCHVLSIETPPTLTVISQTKQHKTKSNVSDDSLSTIKLKTNTRYSLSGISPNDEEGKNTITTSKDKVQSWLRTLEDDRRVSNNPETSDRERSSDAVINSIGRDNPLGEIANPVFNVNSDKAKRLESSYEERQTQNSTRRHSSECRSEEKQKEKSRRFLESRNLRSMRADKTDDGWNDVNKSTATKETWSRVEKFGKEMRTRRRKVRSLNVSIENTNKQRKSDDVTEQGSVKSWLIAGTLHTDKKRNKVGTSEELIKDAVDRQEYEKEPAKTGTPLKETRDKIVPSESSFITLARGEQVRIKSLNSDQMNDIIGVGDGDCRNDGEDEDDPSTGRICGKGTLSLRRHSESGNSPERMTRNEGTLLWKSPPFPLSAKEHSPPETRRIQKISEIFPSPTFQTPLPSEMSVHRLSLRKNQGSGSKSDASPMPQDTSRLSSVKRDLSEEMFQSKRDATEEDRTKSRINGTRREKCNDRENTTVKRNDPSQTAAKGSNPEEISVRFVKLSKIHKRRMNTVKFLYLGAMRHRESRNIEVNARLGDSGAFERVETVDRAVEAIPKNEGINRAVQTVPSYVDQSKSTIDYHFPNKQTHESMDVIFMSLSDDTQQESATKSNTKDQRNEPDKKATNTVGPSLAVKDSQEFYPTQPLVHERFPVVERTKRLETEENDKRNNSQNGKGNSFSELKGVHSRALMRTQWRMGKSDGSNVSIASKSNAKETKLSSTSEKETRYEGKRNQLDNDFSDGAESEHSFSSKNTLKVHNNNGKKTFSVLPSKFEASKMHCLGRSSDDLDSRFVKNVSLSSDTDTTHRKEIKNVQEETKRKYKRIVSASSSDTDSSEIVCESKKNRNQFNTDDGTTKESSTLNDSTKAVDLQTSKRKRTSFEESDNVDLNAILEDWCVDPNMSQRKRSKLDDTVWTKLEKTAITTLKSEKSYLKNRTELAASRDLSTVESDMFASCDVLRIRKESSTEQIKIEKTGNEFNDMIDKVRHHIRTERSSVDDDALSRGFKDQDIMLDNFDDVIANVDTQALIGLPQSEDIVLCSNTDDQQHRKAVRRTSSVLNSIKHISSSPDKENDVRRVRSEETQLTVDRSSHDKTLVPEDFAIVNEGDRDPLKKTISRNDRLRAVEGLSERVSDDGKANSRRSTPTIPDDICSASKTDNNVTEMENSSHDQDSLMNITQYQLMFKQFEEDLFRPEKNRDQAKSSSVDVLKEKRTAGKGETDVNRENTNTCMKDAEQSGGEEDIVESTPDTKMKNGQAFNVTSRRNVRSITPVSRSNDTVSTSTPSPSPVTEYSSSSVATPFSKGRMIPLCQSTPKSSEFNVTENRIGNPTCTDKEKLECISNTNVLLAKQVKDNAVGSACRPASPKLCFVCSGLDSGQTEQVKELAETFNGEFTKQFTPKVTHVIIKTGENNAAAKTLKYLQGVAYKKWIVGFKWVADCLKEKKFLDEDPYEAVDGVTLEAGPRNSRLRRRGLFEEFTFLCIGPYNAVSVEEYQDLLLANGAVVVHSLEALIALKDKLKIIMIQSDVHDDHIIDWYRQASAVPITHDWVVECISQYKLISFYPFLQELVPQDVLALGFSEHLVEEEDISDSDMST